MPEPGVVDGVVALPLEPEPMPLEPGVVGLVVLPVELEPLVLPDAPAPALPLVELPLRASSMHLSRSAPVRPTHLLASAPDAPDAAPPDALPDVLVSLEPEDELPLAEGVDDDELPLADGVDDELPAAGLDAPLLPELEPEDWPNAALDSARSAAAVAAVRVFNIMRGISFEGWINMAAAFCTQAPCRLRPRNVSALRECFGSGARLSARRDQHDRNRTCGLPDIA